MEPSNKTTPGFEAPAPSNEVMPPAADGSAELSPIIPEQAPANAEREPLPAAPPIIQPAANIPLPQPPVAAVPTSDVGTTTPPATPVADDESDRIEKEWVEKAKQIVEQTRDDPHKQSQELTVFKADYMKKRYGKTVKLT